VTSDSVMLKEIPGHSKDYVAGDDGHIYSLKSGKPVRLKGNPDGSGSYLGVWAYPNDQKRVTRSVHTLVLLAFHGPRPSEHHTASHINGNGHDNRPTNLRWEEHKDNLYRKNDHGTHDRGLNNSRACLNPETLYRIRELLCQGVLTQQEIADQVGISRTMVSRIKTGKKYADF
jgi:hypothetical protein